MSHAATDWAFELRLPWMQKLVLLHLCQRHNGETDLCDPSLGELALECEMSRKSVMRARAELERCELLKRQRRCKGGEKLTNCYTLAVGAARQLQDGEAE